MKEKKKPLNTREEKKRKRKATILETKTLLKLPPT